MNETQHCPKCGTPLPGDAMEGLCPKCMARVVFGDEQAGAGKPSDLSDKTVKTPESDISIEQTGMMIGRYKLLEQIGEGGFGVVYMAEQMEPVKRKVALKIIKAGMDTRAVVARFEAERQAAALMDHANIAQVYDGGVTQAGRPYFVMELVRGIPITDYCDQCNLDTTERLKLFIQVCKAVQHAHQKGIIHRDLKPSNIMVTLHDGEPVPKIIDFGVAKALGQRLTEKTLFTGFMNMVGTPAYMSPEQAELSGLDIDTRSDIYSLGVLLYELLTGVTPFDGETLRDAALDEVRRMIRETEPPKPSTRVQTLGDSQAEVARHRHTDPPKLIHLLRGDLDWIVMQCLDKDRRRRYDTANGLVRDLQRHLDDEPVTACPPSRLYAFQKTVRRHKFGFAAAGLLIAVLVAGVLVSSWQAVRATRAERAARTEAARSEQVAQFMKDMLGAAAPSVARGRDATLLKEVLEKTAERIKIELKDQPQVQGDLWFTLGVTFKDIGDRNRAISMFEEAVVSYRSGSGEKSTEIALSLGNLGYCQSFCGDIASGSNSAALGLEIARKCSDPKTLVTCLTRMGSSLNHSGMVPAAGEPFYREAVELQRELGDDPLRLAGALVVWAQSHQPEDEALIREALDLYCEYAEPDDPRIGSGLFALGQLLLDAGRLEEAEATLKEATEIMSTVWDKEHPYQSLVRMFYARALLGQGKAAEAEAILREGIQDGLNMHHRGAYLGVLAKALNKMGEGDEDRIRLELMAMGEPSNPEHLEALGNMCASLSDWTTAASYFSQAAQLNSADEDNLFNLAIVLLRSEREADYRGYCSEYLDLAEARRGDWGTVDKAAKASLLLPVGGSDFRRASELADHALTLERGQDWDKWAHLLKALVEYRRGDFEEVQEWANRVISPDVERADCKAAAWFILASAEASMRRFESGRKAFAEGDELVIEFRDHDVRWRDWAIAEHLRQEAVALLEGEHVTAEQPD